MTPTNTEALAAELEKQRVSNWIHSTGVPPIIHGTKPDPLCQQAAAELRRLSAENEALQRKLQEQALQALTNSTENAELLAERDRFASESAQHFVRAREWAERAGQMEAERDALRADAERYRWLREHGFAFADVSLGTDYEGQDYVTYRVGFHLPEPAHNKYDDDEWSAEDIDAAIDAARAAMKGTP